jgi:AcrR family transcriptional regulator
MDRIAEVTAVMEAAARPGAVETEIARRFRAFIARDRDWPLVFYEFWSAGIRDRRLRAEFGRMRQTVRSEMAAAIQAVGKTHGFQLRFPADQLAAAVIAVINGLAFERVADPEAISEELAAFAVASLLAGAGKVEGERRG